MAQTTHFQQVHWDLMRSLHGFTECIKEALELWWQETEELPRHMQPPELVAASHAVQAALHEAPLLLSQGEPGQLSWLFKHLPDISTAMQQSLCSQVGTISKRVGILQSVVKTRQGQEDAQLTARLEAERATFLQLSNLIWVWYMVLPISTLAAKLAAADGSLVVGGKPNRRKLLQASQEHGKWLISYVGSGFDQCYTKVWQYQSSLQQVHELLYRMGEQLLNAPYKFERSHRMRCVHKCLSCVCARLALLAVCLLPDKAGIATLMYVMQSLSLAVGSICRPHFMPQLLCEILAQPALRAALLQTLPHRQLVHILQLYKVSAWLLHAIGMSAQQQKDLLSALGVDERILHDPHAHEAKQPASESESGSGQGSVAPSLRLVAEAEDSKASSGGEAGNEVVGDGNDLDDMKALLRLMYGCSVAQ